MESSIADRVLQHLKENRAAYTGFLERLVSMETPSEVPRTHGPVIELLRDELAEVGYRVLVLPGIESGGHLYARPERRARGRPVQLLLGHYDTVWPVGTLSEMPIIHHDGIMRGPGIYDMKAGVANVLFALRALRAAGAEPRVTPVVFINADEEVGSWESTAAVSRLARVSERTFVLEPSLGPSGQLKTSRKGIGKFVIHVSGRAAHSGLDPQAGASAIEELSYVIQHLFALNDADRGISVNVGMIDGGIRANVVAPESRAIVDVRVPEETDGERITREVYGLRPVNSDVDLRVEGGMGRPPLERTPRNAHLWELARSAGRILGLDLSEAAAGGGSDGSTTSRYCATLDGLGAVGIGAHAPDESIDVDRTLERCALLCLLLLLPPLDEIEPAQVEAYFSDLAAPT